MPPILGDCSGYQGHATDAGAGFEDLFSPLTQSQLGAPAPGGGQKSGAFRSGPVASNTHLAANFRKLFFGGHGAARLEKRREIQGGGVAGCLG